MTQRSVVSAFFAAVLGLGAIYILVWRQAESQSPTVASSPQPLQDSARPEAGQTSDDLRPAVTRSALAATLPYSELIHHLLFGPRDLFSESELLLSNLIVTEGVNGSQLVAAIVTELLGDLKSGNPRFAFPQGSARVLWQVEVLSAKALEHWKDYVRTQASSLSHKSLRRLLARWPLSAEDFQRMEAIVNALREAETEEEVLNLCRDLLYGDELSRRALARGLERMMAENRSATVARVLSGYLLYGQADRDFPMVASVIARRQAAFGDSRVDPAVMMAAQQFSLMLSGISMVSRPLPGLNDWTQALFALSHPMLQTTGSGILAAVGMGAGAGSSEFIDRYEEMYLSTGHSLVQSTILINLGRVASYWDIVRIAGINGSLVSEHPDPARAKIEMAAVQGMLNMAINHPHYNQLVAGEVGQALKVWGADRQLRKQYLELLSLLAISPLPEVTRFLHTLKDSSGPDANLIKRAYEACRDSRH